MTVWQFYEKVSIHADTKDKEEETLETPFTRLHGLLSIARKPFVGGSINWALSVPFFTLQRSIYLLSYVLLSVANLPFRLSQPRLVD